MKHTILRILSVLILVSLLFTALASCLDNAPTEEDNNTNNGGQTDDGKTDDGKTDDGKTDDGKTDDGNPEGPDEEYHVSVTFFDPQNDTEVVVLVKNGEKLTEPDEPTYDGYTFLGWTIWSDDALDFVPYDFDTVLTSETEDFVLWAAWEEEEIPMPDYSAIIAQLLPKDVNVLFELKGVRLKVQNTEEGTYTYNGESVTLAPVFVDYTQGEDDVIALWCGFDENGMPFLLAQVNLQAMGGSSSRSGHWDEEKQEYVYDSATYETFDVEVALRSALLGTDLYVTGRAVAVSEEDLYIKIDLIQTLMALMQRIPMEQIMGLIPEELQETLSNVMSSVDPEEILNKLLEMKNSESEAPDFSALLDLFFEKNEDGTVYTLSYDKIRAINNDLNTLTVEELVNKYFGSGTFSMISGAIEMALDMTVEDALTLAENLGMTEEQLIEAFNMVAPSLSLPDDFDLSAWLEDETIRSAKILSLIAPEEEEQAKVKATVKGILDLCEETSLYSLVEQMMTPPAEDQQETATEDVPDLYNTVNNVIGMVESIFAYSFTTDGEKIVSQTFTIHEIDIPVAEDTVLTLGFSLTVKTNVETPFEWTAEDVAEPVENFQLHFEEGENRTIERDEETGEPLSYTFKQESTVYADQEKTDLLDYHMYQETYSLSSPAMILITVNGGNVHQSLWTSRFTASSSMSKLIKDDGSVVYVDTFGEEYDELPDDLQIAVDFKMDYSYLNNTYTLYSIAEEEK